MDFSTANSRLGPAIPRGSGGRGFNWLVHKSVVSFIMRSLWAWDTLRAEPPFTSRKSLRWLLASDSQTCLERQFKRFVFKAALFHFIRLFRVLSLSLEVKGGSARRVSLRVSLRWLLASDSQTCLERQFKSFAFKRHYFISLDYLVLLFGQS
jgi:hypothetical protein